MALRYYASGSFLKVIGDTLSISKTCVSRSIHSVTECLCEIAAD